MGECPESSLALEEWATIRYLPYIRLQLVARQKIRVQCFKADLRPRFDSGGVARVTAVFASNRVLSVMAMFQQLSQVTRFLLLCAWKFSQSF